ncbi:unnamed protein product [Fusarium graminearum]|uniref:Uncharacterized protein n=1 Tax=Gibberella zeae TaxID=5518 RepID=A0A4E9DLG0_GIBZA|nr:unnamed protein product [Fusarium graminearum]CAF3527714.1 unnamed protein product [Fusarium graminearum]CAG1966736.1 unnamed protein product [Fusarium graminearum]CAG1999501.1 unnamed protein product [Fusarium graminearum]
MDGQVPGSQDKDESGWKQEVNHVPQQSSFSKHSGSGYEGPDRLSRTQMSGFKKAKCKDNWNTKKHAGTAQAAWVFVLSCPDAMYSSTRVSFVNPSPSQPASIATCYARVFNWQLLCVQYSICESNIAFLEWGAVSESKGQKRETRNCTGWFSSLLNAGKQQQGVGRGLFWRDKPDRMAANEIFGQGETMPFELESTE